MTGNKLQVSDIGIHLRADAGNPASFNQVKKNSVQVTRDTAIGIVFDVSATGTANKNQFKSNTITDPANAYTGTIGIRLNNTGGLLDGTVLKSNKLINMDTPYDHTGDTNTVIKGNTCTPTSPCVTP